MTEKDIQKLLTGIQKVFERSFLTADQQLWNEQDVAEYFKYSLDYTKKNIIAHPNFPPSRDLPTSPTGDRVAKRWKAKDIIDFGMAFDKASINYTKRSITA